MLYLLYKNRSTGETGFAELDKEFDTDIKSDFEAMNPSFHVVAIYDHLNNLIAYEAQQHARFVDNCRRYGFEPCDYKRKVSLGNGRTGEFVGFRTTNRKYTCLVTNPDRPGTFLKAPPEYVRINFAD